MTTPGAKIRGQRASGITLANSVRDFEGMAHPLRSKPSFDQHQCRLDLNDLRAGKTSKGGKNETVTSSVVLVRTRFYPVRMAGLVRGPQMEMVRPVLASISDPALRAALQEAHAERLGLWVAVWPVTLLILSQILEWKMQDLRNR